MPQYRQLFVPSVCIPKLLESEASLSGGSTSKKGMTFTIGDEEWQGVMGSLPLGTTIKKSDLSHFEVKVAGKGSGPRVQWGSIMDNIPVGTELTITDEGCSLNLPAPPRVGGGAR